MAKRRRTTPRIPVQTSEHDPFDLRSLQTIPVTLSRRTIWTLLAILVLAGGLRFWSLDTAPPGVYHDEAINGVQGWEAAQTGQYKIFYPENNGREGLLINLIGLAEKIAGPSAASLRFWPALFGTLTVPGLFLLALGLFHSESIALLAAFFLAVSFWHLDFSRVAFSGILVPFFLCWGIGFLLATRTRAGTAGGRLPGYLMAAAGGVLFGLGFHSYIAFRFAPILAILCIAVVWPRESPGRREFLKFCLVWSAGALAAALPLLVYFLRHPRDFFGRAREVSLWLAPNPLDAFVNGCWDTLMMFHVRGDSNWRHNISGSPELLWPVGLLLLLGIWIALKSSAQETRLRDKLFNRFSLPLWWIAVMLLPEELTVEGIPHALRSIGVLPGVMILAAAGTDALLRRFKAKPFRWFIAMALALTAAANAYRYFGVWAEAPETAWAFNSRLVDIGKRFNALPPGQPRFAVVFAGGGGVPHRNPDGVVKNIPMPAETVMFETLGHPPVTYLLPDEAQTYSFPPDAHIEAVR